MALERRRPSRSTPRLQSGHYARSPPAIASTAKQTNCAAEPWLAGPVERSEQLGDHPVRRLLGLGAGLEQLVEPARNLDLGGQHAGVVRRDSVAFVAFALGVGQLRQRRPAIGEERVVELERKQV